jgi:general stress protein YciG
MWQNFEDNENMSSKRGFASMDEEKRREIASQGGKAAHEKGTAHEFDSNEAREAGRKGGQARAQNQSGNNSSQNSSQNTENSEEENF